MKSRLFLIRLLDNYVLPSFDLWIDCFHEEKNEEMNKELPKITAFTKVFHGVASELKKEFAMKIRVPSRCMLACYPGSGARYLAHRDNEAIRPNVFQNSREVTAILYINPDWKQGDGGELCAHLGAKADDQEGSRRIFCRQISCWVKRRGDSLRNGGHFMRKILEIP